jgi:hypothetical protein
LISLAEEIFPQLQPDAARGIRPCWCASPPIYFMLLQWTDGRVETIRDLRYAR